jgi:hypothetical protein
MTSNQRGTKGFEEMFDYLRDSHLLVLPYNGTKDYKKLVENFKETREMKLHEEFKEYENMWEATDRRKIRQHFYKTKNCKKYDLLDEKDFRAYIEDAPPEARPHTIMWVRSAVVHECDGNVRFPEEARKMADRVARELSAKYYDKPLTEDSKCRRAYKALMEVQAALSDIPGWDTVDIQKDTEYDMTIKYDLADDTYVWYELDDGEYEYVEEVAEVEELCQRLGVSMSINDANKDYYNIIVYLNYEG